MFIRNTFNSNIQQNRNQIDDVTSSTSISLFTKFAQLPYFIVYPVKPNQIQQNKFYAGRKAL